MFHKQKKHYLCLSHVVHSSTTSIKKQSNKNGGISKMDVNTIVNVITILIAIGNFIFLLSITRKIEGIKNSYATSLETHKWNFKKSLNTLNT